jgi:hypothetical protein
VVIFIEGGIMYDKVYKKLLVTEAVAFMLNFMVTGQALCSEKLYARTFELNGGVGLLCQCTSIPFFHRGGVYLECAGCDSIYKALAKRAEEISVQVDRYSDVVDLTHKVVKVTERLNVAILTLIEFKYIRIHCPFEYVIDSTSGYVLGDMFYECLNVDHKSISYNELYAEIENVMEPDMPNLPQGKLLVNSDLSVMFCNVEKYKWAHIVSNNLREHLQQK